MIYDDTKTEIWKCGGTIVASLYRLVLNLDTMNSENMA